VPALVFIGRLSDRFWSSRPVGMASIAAASSSTDVAQHVNVTGPPAPLLATMSFGTAVTMPHGTEPDPRRLDMPRLNHFWRPFWKPKALTAIVRETLPSTLHL
jgi:hypothetical protein